MKAILLAAFAATEGGFAKGIAPKHDPSEGKVAHTQYPQPIVLEGSPPATEGRIVAKEDVYLIEYNPTNQTWIPHTQHPQLTVVESISRTDKFILPVYPGDTIKALKARGKEYLEERKVQIAKLGVHSSQVTTHDQLRNAIYNLKKVLSNKKTFSGTVDYSTDLRNIVNEIKEDLLGLGYPQQLLSIPLPDIIIEL